MSLKIGIVAGEKSGDYLGAELVREFKKRFPNAEFVGLGGPEMISEGVVSLGDMDKISIMGIMGVLRGLRDILQIRRTIKKHMLAWKPDVFIGIDVPDFNLHLERKLKESGIPVAHYVSPTVWAWRTKRIVKIKKSIDLMLTLFPFEKDFYQKHNTPVEFVGHPFAREVLNWHESEAFQGELEKTVSENEQVIAVLPGSRRSEVSRLTPVMFESIRELSSLYPQYRFVVPAANQGLYEMLHSMASETSTPVTILNGYSRDILHRCEFAILASGTAALEAALFGKPMIVMYKVAKVEEWYAARSMVVKHFSMPNHLTNPPVVSELIQENATSKNLNREFKRLVEDTAYYQHQKASLSDIAPLLSQDSGKLAADAIEQLIKQAKRARKNSAE